MAFDEILAHRIREVISERDDYSERRMFGGIAFMVGGHMACGPIGSELMARVGSDAYEAALCEPHVREMEFTGRPMRGFVTVAAEGIAADAQLRRWVERCASFAASLPAK